MSRAVEELILDERRDIALRMLEAKKFSIEDIVSISKLSLEEVQKIAIKHSL